MRKKHDNIVMLPFAAPAREAEEVADRVEVIEAAMNNIGSIITLLHATVEGERFTASRAWLAEELEKNFILLDARLNESGAHV